MDPFDSPYWNLSQTLAWIRWRDSEQVAKYAEEPESGFTAEIMFGDEKPSFGGDNDLLDALKDGKLEAHGLINGKGDLVPIEPVKWVDKIFKSIPPRAISSNRSGRGLAWYDELRFPSAKVKRLWPKLGGRDLTGTAEKKTQQWLFELIRESSERQPKPRREYYEEAIANFNVGKNAFDRAWRNAINSIENNAWGRPGRPRKTSH